MKTAPHALVSLIGSLYIGVLSFPAHARSDADVLARARRSTVTITTKTYDGSPTGIGSGFVVASNGLIVTAEHVVRDQYAGTVNFANGRSYPFAYIAYRNKAYDVAIVRIFAEGLTALKMGNSSSVRQGDRVLTLGSPEGLDFTASEGMVSAKRTVGTWKLIQITAPISSGSSGGPVLNKRGEAVGVVTRSFQDAQNLNFSVSCDHVKQALEAVRETEHAIARKLKASRPSLRSASVRSQGKVFTVGKLGVATRKAVIHVERDVNSEALSALDSGTYIALNSVNGAWYGVLMADRSTGWIRKSDVRILDYEVVSNQAADAAAVTSKSQSNKPQAQAKEPASDSESNITLDLPASPDATATFDLLNQGQRKILEFAYGWLGAPFKAGGTTVKGVDGGAFVQRCYIEAGIKLPRSPNQQIAYGVPVSSDALQTADRLYFANSKGDIVHTGIYIGNGYFIHASPQKKVVTVSRLTEDKYTQMYAGARR